MNKDWFYFYRNVYVCIYVTYVLDLQDFMIFFFYSGEKVKFTVLTIVYCSVVFSSIK